MKINDLVIDPQKTLGRKQIVTGVAPRYIYDANGKRTDEVRGFNYTCVCPERSYTSVRIAIDGPQQMDDVTIAGCPMVVFDGLEIKAYVVGGEGHVSITAKGIRVLKNPTD